MIRFPLTFGLQKTGLPLIIVSCNSSKNICFLIDTGSTHNIIFDFVYKHIKQDFKLLLEEQAIFGIEGNAKSYPIAEGIINFEGNDYTSIFTIMDASDAIEQVQEETDIQIHGILGINFLMTNKLIIDFDILEIRSNEVNI